MTTQALEIATFLGKMLVGNNVVIFGPKPLTDPIAHSLLFVNKYSAELVENLNSMQDVLVLAIPEYEGQLQVSHIITPQPRLDFAKVVGLFFAPPQRDGISSTAFIAKSAKLGNNVRIGHFCVIDEDVEIGDNTQIRDHVVIRYGCIIGKNCTIKSSTVIGDDGFGFEIDSDGTPIRIPHIGRVVIGDYVEIGALNTVVRATLGETVVSDNVKTDDHIHIAHNVFIGKNTLITACAEISGSVRIGKNVWIGPQVSIIDGIEIGDNAFIGLGAVVTKSVEPGVVVAGNPARVLRYRRQD